jgi:hypothetical protein
MDKTRPAFFLVYSEMEHKGEYHLYIRGLFSCYAKAFTEAIRLTKREPYEGSEQPDYTILHEKEDEVRLINNNYEDDDSTHEEIVIGRQYVQ